MATNLQQSVGRIQPAHPRHTRQLAGWLVALAALFVLLGLGALGSGPAVERAAPGIEASAPGAAPERPVFDGRGKWTGY